jgi:hypothetical protein
MEKVGVLLALMALLMVCCAIVIDFIGVSYSIVKSLFISSFIISIVSVLLYIVAATIKMNKN